MVGALKDEGASKENLGISHFDSSMLYSYDIVEVQLMLLTRISSQKSDKQPHIPSSNFRKRRKVGPDGDQGGLL